VCVGEKENKDFECKKVKQYEQTYIFRSRNESFSRVIKTSRTDLHTDRLFSNESVKHQVRKQDQYLEVILNPELQGDLHGKNDFVKIFLEYLKTQLCRNLKIIFLELLK